MSVNRIDDEERLESLSSPDSVYHELENHNKHVCFGLQASATYHETAGTRSEKCSAGLETGSRRLSR